MSKEEGHKQEISVTFLNEMQSVAQDGATVYAFCAHIFPKLPLFKTFEQVLKSKNSRLDLICSMLLHDDLQFGVMKIIALHVTVTGHKAMLASVVDLIIRISVQGSIESSKELFWKGKLKYDGEALSSPFNQLNRKVVSAFRRSEHAGSKSEMRYLAALSSKIMRRASNPVLIFGDYLRIRLASGNPSVSVLTLKPLFVLMTEHGFDCNDFFDKIYDLLPHIMVMTSASSLLRMIRLCLSSVGLTNELQTKFENRFADLALTSCPTELLSQCLTMTDRVDPVGVAKALQYHYCFVVADRAREQVSYISSSKNAKPGFLSVDESPVAVVSDKTKVKDTGAVIYHNHRRVKLFDDMNWVWQ